MYLMSIFKLLCAVLLQSVRKYRQIQRLLIQHRSRLDYTARTHDNPTAAATTTSSVVSTSSVSNTAITGTLWFFLFT